MTEAISAGVATARDYYDSEEADNFYATIWGGEDIHVGIYEESRDIREASRATVDRMAKHLGSIEGKHVLDLGAGFGGAARVLAREYGARVTCLNLSRVENERNRQLTREAGLGDRIAIIDGSFDAMPFDEIQFDIAWSQDAILHAPDRRAVLDEIARVLAPGGELIFTDPMQADRLDDPSALRPIYDRIHLPDLASVGFYRDELLDRGLSEVDVEILTHELRNHYARVAEELDARRSELAANDAFVDRMLEGLSHWVEGADKGLLAWGILHFRKGQ
ncbi:methyltransferase domain-containing protein [Parasphingopyxis marina]|uniref:Methyltransferase domain-containing protein n=1 Tax=Parasphingopyxis marina TaxID=2761622 RepID=A0A842HVX0_9SPHN|nr:methyltransferase domain-containing protein [Parasphingopyxis marina]MBC2776511.1 methyltransferase domain-containing protein [Parasphingopyxis marina]